MPRSETAVKPAILKDPDLLQDFLRGNFMRVPTGTTRYHRYEQEKKVFSTGGFTPEEHERLAKASARRCDL